MGRVADKLLLSQSVVVDPYTPTTGQYTKGVGLGASAVMGYDVEDIDNALKTDTVIDTALSHVYEGAVDATRNLGFLCNYSTDGFVCVDFSDVTNVSVLDSIVSSTYLDFTRGVAIDTVAEIAYVTGITPNYFNAIDYSTPTAMSITSSLSTTYGCDLIVLDSARDTAFTKAGGRLTSINTADPASMSERATLVNSAVMQTAGGLAIDITRDLVFTSHYSNDSVTVLDTTSVAAVTVTSTLTDTVELNQVTKLNIDTTDELLFCLGTSKLSVVDYSNTASMSISDTITNTAFGTGVARTVEVDKVRKLVFVKALSQSSIWVYDYSTPTALVLAKEITANVAPMFYLGGIAP